MASIFNTVTTVAGRVQRILNFVESGRDFYVAIGKPTPWNTSFGRNISDSNPPSPTARQLEVPEPIIYKKVKCVAPASRIQSCFSGPSTLSQDQLALLDPEDIACRSVDFNVGENADILLSESFTEQNYLLHNPNDIAQQGGTFSILPEFIYVQADIISEDYTADTWRSSGLYTRLFLAAGVPTGQDIYIPNQVTGGLLQQITFNSPVTRDEGKSHRFEYLITL